jgi:hypothetical protein
MKILKGLFCLVTVVLLAWGEQVCAAVTVTNITKSEYDTLTSTYEAAFSVVFRGGGSSGFGSEEIQVARNTSNPQLGGGTNTVIGNLTWGQPATNVWIQLDALSNISAGAGSTTVTPISWAIVRPFNQLLVLVADSEIFGSTSELQNSVINSQTFPNLLADGNGLYDYRVISVTGLGGAFDYSGAWAPGPYPSTGTQFVKFVGINNTTIPEPTTCFLTFFSAVLLLVRRRN